MPLNAEWSRRGKISHGFTHFIIELEVWAAFAGRRKPGGDGAWCRLADLDRLAVPTLTRKVLEQALSGEAQPARQPAKARARPRIISK